MLILLLDSPSADALTLIRSSDFICVSESLAATTFSVKIIDLSVLIARLSDEQGAVATGENARGIRDQSRYVFDSILSTR